LPIQSPKYVLVLIQVFTLIFGIAYVDNAVVATLSVGRDPQGIAGDTTNNMI